MKYGNVTLGQVEATINKLGGQEVWDAWLRGEKTVTVEDAIRLLFDNRGRRIPEGLHNNVRDANRDFWLNWPKLNETVGFANRIMRLHGCLGIDTEVSAEQFKAETERLLAIIRNNPRIVNIANGVYLPVILPRRVADNFGAELELYLAGVANSYAKTFRDRKFCNYLKDALVEEVSIVDGSQHNQLIERIMKRGPVIGIHFPNPLQGFSTNASREQMPALPEGFILSGMDTPIAMMMYPDILARDWNTPGLSMAALNSRSTGFSFHFKAGYNNLDFDLERNLNYPYEYCSSGLLFLG